MVGGEIEQKLETYWWLIKCIEFISLGEGFQIYVMQVDTISKPKNETDFRLLPRFCDLHSWLKIKRNWENNSILTLKLESLSYLAHG